MAQPFASNAIRKHTKMKINGGYYMKARKIQESKIHRHPPYVREIWDWLLMNANHSDNKYKGHEIKRGQLFRTYKDIREGLAWYVGYRKEMYNENHTKRAMKILREARMVDTTKAPGGVMITILNYDKYQDPKNYESTNESTNESTLVEPRLNQGGTDNNKNEKKRDLSGSEESRPGKEPNKKENNIELYSRIIDALNSKTGQKYKPTTKKTQSLIQARLNDGFNEADFLTVIDNKVKSWLGNEKYSIFLRPETLFSNKFEGYLNEIPPKEKPEPKRVYVTFPKRELIRKKIW